MTSSEKPRIAHVWSSDMGLSLSLPYCRPLVERGWEVYGICPDGPRLSAVRDAGIQWLPHQIERRLTAANDVRGVAQLVRYFRKHRFHIVHTHNVKVGLLARVAAAASGVPCILHTMHGIPFWPHTPHIERVAIAALERVANLRTDAVLVQSEEDQATVLGLHMAPPSRVVYVGNGIEVERFRARSDSRQRDELRRALGVMPGDVLYVSAGRLVKEKGFCELFEAAARARASDPRVRLAVAGPVDSEKADAVEPSELERAERAGVLLLGERDDMPALYAAADVVVLASWREGLPRVLIEAAAAGKPLVATDVRGCREVVRPPANGLLVPVRSADALAAAMVDLARRPDLRERLGRENANEATHRWDIRVVVERVVTLYDRLLTQRGVL